jgi:hypothetical protein
MTTSLSQGTEVDCCSGSESDQLPLILNRNPGFEYGIYGWETYIEASISTDAIIREEKNCVLNGKGSLFLRLPSNATDNQKQFISIGQYLPLSKSKQYRLSVHVKWANPEGQLSSAIISIWTKSAEGNFAGKDVWIYDGDDFKYLSFDFSPDSDGNTFCYLSLLTNQAGYENTDIYVDDFKIEELGYLLVEEDPRPSGINLLKNSDFDEDFASWSNTVNNPHDVAGLNCSLINQSKNNVLRMELPGSGNPEYLNNTWTGICQDIKLYAGNKYRIEVDLNRIIPDLTQYETIVNIYALNPGTSEVTPLWLGSVDYKFNRSGWHTYSKCIKPTQTGDYSITLRLFGWGNEGNPVKLDVDNIEVKLMK